MLGEIGLTPRAKKVIELAVDEARRLNHHYIGTEHLLLGLVREGEGIAAGVLESLGVNLEMVRTQTIQILSAPNDEPDPIQQKISFKEVPSSKQQTIFSKEIALLHQLPVNNGDQSSPFTEYASKVLTLAVEEARRFQHKYIGDEHLLLGLIGEEEGIARQVLVGLGVERKKIRSAVEFIIGRGDQVGSDDQVVQGELGLTLKAKKVIELAADEARRLNHHSIGTPHLLLGLVREGEGIAAGVLESLGINLEKVRLQTIQYLSIHSAQSSQSAPSSSIGETLFFR